MLRVRQAGSARWARNASSDKRAACRRLSAVPDSPLIAPGNLMGDAYGWTVGAPTG